MLLKLQENRLVPAGTTSHETKRGKTVRIANETVIEDAGIEVNKFDVIELEFPAGKDGRAFTQARQLREGAGYAGELRATGEILRDQILFMVRCGFTSFVVEDGADIAGLNDALAEFSWFYQPAPGLSRPVWQLRNQATQPQRRIA